MSTNKKKVFLDANIVISAGKPPGGPELARVVDLAKAERITVLTTDLTMSEITRRHTRNHFEKIKVICQPGFRKTVEEATGTQIPEVAEAQLWGDLYKKWGLYI